MKKYLVVVAHPDDETLGCGGSIAKWSKNGDQVKCIFMADGEKARFNESQLILEKDLIQKLIERRKEAAGAALEVLGVPFSNFYDLPDNRLDQIPLLELTKLIENEVMNYEPDIVVTHSGADLNVDHRKVHEAVVTATRPPVNPYIEKTLFFENLSSTEWSLSGYFQKFSPNHYEDISGFLRVKLQALAVYENEMRSFPHPRSPQAVCGLAAYRGSNIGFIEAEAFEIGWQRSH